MTGEVWILGATGRAGRAVADRLHSAGATPVLVGRDSVRLEQAASAIGGARTVSGPFEQVLEQIQTRAPGVLINTIGPFTRTSMPVWSACPPGTHYLDVSSASSTPEPLPPLPSAVATERIRSLVFGPERVSRSAVYVSSSG